MQLVLASRALLAATALSLTAACSMAPDYRPPETAAPAAYKEVSGWIAAAPMDETPRAMWWSTFGDPVLDDLEQRAERASPTLAAALARYDQARAIARDERSDLFPRIDVGGDVARTRASGNRLGGNGEPRTYTGITLGGTLDYEIDLWGRIRNSVAAARADADAGQADLGSARLSLQASVADAYFRLRGLDAQAALLRQTVEAFGRAYDLTSTRHDGGIASGIDVNRAHSVLASARAQISAVAQERAAVEHEIAALVGAVASDFSIPAEVKPLQPPQPPATGAPSELLQRRPDIAAAERRMFATNARIGVARAAWFPSLSLGLSGGVATTRGDLFSTPSTFWGLGPLSSVLTLFDGGRRRAQVALSRADYDEQAASYRETVLGAFRQVEDAIAANRYLATQGDDQHDAAAAAARTRDLAMTRYRDGASDYLEVVTAQTDALAAERAAISIQAQRMRAHVALVRALGGGLGDGAQGS